MHKLMIVDDQVYILEGLKMCLEDDFEVALVDNSEDYMQVIENFKPDIALIDYKMPGKDGIEIIQDIVKRPDHPVIIIFSACLTGDIVDQARTLGAVDWLSKPFDIELLKAKLHRALN